MWVAEEEAGNRERAEVFGPTTIQRAALGLYHTLVIAKKGDSPQLYAWGKNHNNILGLGVELKERVYPGQVAFFAKHPIFEVSCGTNHSIVLVKKQSDGGGKLYSFGLGNGGRLGFKKSTEEDGEEDDVEEAWFTPKPIRIRFEDRVRIARVSCGADHTLAVTEHGVLYSFGVGSHGALGVGDTTDRYNPVQVDFGRTQKYVTHCSAGGKHSLACTQEGNLWAWGHGGKRTHRMRKSMAYCCCLSPQATARSNRGSSAHSRRLGVANDPNGIRTGRAFKLHGPHSYRAAGPHHLLDLIAFLTAFSSRFPRKCRQSMRTHLLLPCCLQAMGGWDWVTRAGLLSPRDWSTSSIVTLFSSRLERATALVSIGRESFFLGERAVMGGWATATRLMYLFQERSRHSEGLLFYRCGTTTLYLFFVVERPAF